MIKIIILAIIYTFFLAGLVLLAMMSSSYVTWQSDDLLYRILKPIGDSIIVIFPLTLIIGYLCIVYYQLKKAYQYLEEVVEAIGMVDSDSSSIIKLEHQELQDVSELLNQTKINIKTNARAAKEAEQRKNDLIVYLAHDLKTPLTSVIGYLMLLKDEKQISKETRQHYLEVTLDKAERLEELINEFFEITRFNLTEQVLDLSKVDMVRLLEQLSYEFKPMLEEKGLTCSLDMPKSLEVKCDVNKMQRVLDNLLRNAVNYAFENTTIQITLENKDNHIYITFHNKGNTIPPEKLDRLFEQFFRLDTSRTSKTGGAGLGLSISKAVIEQHHGTIEASSYDENIIFKIALPML